jgi:hypothetical protein
MKLLVFTSIIAFAALPGVALAQLNLPRAERSYRDLNAGRKQLVELSPIEIEEVLQLAREI